MIQKPQGQALSYNRNTWNVLYYEDGKRKSKSLTTQDLEVATFRRDLFFQDAEAKPRNLLVKENKYIYKQKPYYVKVDKKLVGRYSTEDEARVARDEYLKTLA